MSGFSAILLDQFLPNTPQFAWLLSNSSGPVDSGTSKCASLTASNGYGSDRTSYYIHFTRNRKKFVLCTNKRYASNDEKGHFGTFMKRMNDDIAANPRYWNNLARVATIELGDNPPSLIKAAFADAEAAFTAPVTAPITSSSAASAPTTSSSAASALLDNVADIIGGGLSKKKYLKYKMKYLNLKKNIF